MGLCVIDTETTGLYPANGDRICEIALLAIDDNLQIIDSYESLINPERPISPEAYAVNGIELPELEESPFFSEILEEITEIMDNQILVGHNVSFDYGFLKNEMRLAGRPNYKAFTIDTREMARDMVSLPSYGLSSLIELFNIDFSDRHRAMGDCLATLDLFKMLTGIFASKYNSNLVDMIERYKDNPEDHIEITPDWLKQSIEHGSDIEIIYCDRSGMESRRIIQPLEVFSSNYRVYLEAFCKLRGEKRTFLIERIKKVIIC